MGFGSLLSQEFKNLTNGHFSSEKTLFTKLEDAFIHLSSICSIKYHVDYAVDIIHGTKSHVDFKYNGTYIGSITPPQIRRKELADLMFIVFSPRKREIRLTYMQNKKGATSYQSFKADLLQLYLLKNRPEIDSPTLPICVFGDRRILSDARLPSVGSYGVFYKDISCNTIEMSYFPASNLLPRKPIGGVQRTVKAVGGLGTITVNGYNESQGEATLTAFGDALISMTIGTPMNDDCETLGKMCAFLNKNSKVFSAADFPLFDQYYEDQEIDSFKPQDSFPTVVVINADRFDNFTEAVAEAENSFDGCGE